MTPEEHFRRVYAGNFEAVLAYATRRVPQPADAADVVAETFLVAWRRHREIPPGDEARLWLYGVARRILANHHRGDARRERLRQRLLSFAEAAPGIDLPSRLAVRQALAMLPEPDRELLMLTAWEGLEPREAATVLRIGPAAVRTRLSRARTRLRNLLGDAPGPPGHERDVLTIGLPEERT
ncbi:MAG TPA: sigma-70 family RNA polymerase sigma factor [Actinoplanes sp.]|jgi:RNA polymerase sigma-70 factor (ECF subfamily)